MKHRTFKSLFAAAALAVSLTFAAPASAATIQLGFVLDSSGSIGGANWTTIVNGLSTAINTHIPLAGPDQYEISVVSFSSVATTIVNHVLVTDAASRSAVAASIAAAPFQGNTTNFFAAFQMMQSVLTTAPGYNTQSISYVNFATDGVPDDNAAGIAARNNLIAAGIENISIEGIGGGVNAASLTGSYCFPQPCDTVLPFNTFPAQGFYIGVPDAAAYAAAIGLKVQVVTGQAVPEPTSVLLLGTGLLVAVSRLRRRKK